MYTTSDMHTLYRKSPLFRVSHIRNFRWGATRAKINSSKILPFQAPKARRVQYHSSELRYCTRRFECEHPTWMVGIPQPTWSDSFGRAHRGSYLSFPRSLWPLQFLPAAQKSKDDATMFTNSPITVDNIERYLEPDIVLTTNASEGGGVGLLKHSLQFSFPVYSVLVSSQPLYCGRNIDHCYFRFQPSDFSKQWPIDQHASRSQQGAVSSDWNLVPRLKSGDEIRWDDKNGGLMSL